MSVFVLDTGVASAFLPGISHPLRLVYAPTLRGHAYAVSVQTQAELWFGAEKGGWGPGKRASIQRFLDGALVVPAETSLGLVWAQVMAHAQRVGRRLAVADGWVVATAIAQGLPLITHDRDLVGLNYPGLEVVCHAV